MRVPTVVRSGGRPVTNATHASSHRATSRGVASTATSPERIASAVSASVTTREAITITIMIDRDVLTRVLSQALGRGGDFAEVFAEERENTTTSVDDGRVEGVSSGRSRGAGIRVIRGETTGFAHTADLTEEGLLAAARAAATAVAAPEGTTREVSLEEFPVDKAHIDVQPSGVAKSD